MQTKPQERCVALSGNIATPATNLTFPPPPPPPPPPPCVLCTCFVPLCLSVHGLVWGEMFSCVGRQIGYRIGLSSLLFF